MFGLVNVVFPAHAGMNRSLTLRSCITSCVPRPRGDEPVDIAARALVFVCSPPTRG